MAECSLDHLDLLHAIRYGRITHDSPGPYRETPRRFCLEGKSLAGRPMACIVDINDELVLVTAYSKRMKKSTADRLNSREDT